MDAMYCVSIYPEILLLVMACVVALVDLYVTCPRRTPTYLLTLGTIAVVALMHLAYFNAGVSASKFSIPAGCSWTGFTSNGTKLP